MSRTTGILTPAAAERVGRPSLAQHLVEYILGEPTWKDVASHVYYDWNLVATTVSIGPEGIIPFDPRHETPLSIPPVSMMLRENQTGKVFLEQVLYIDEWQFHCVHLYKGKLIDYTRSRGNGPYDWQLFSVPAEEAK